MSTRNGGSIDGNRRKWLISLLVRGERWVQREKHFVVTSARARLTIGFLMTRALASARSAEPRSNFLLQVYSVGRIVTL